MTIEVKLNSSKNLLLYCVSIHTKILLDQILNKKKMS